MNLCTTTIWDWEVTCTSLVGLLSNLGFLHPLDMFQASPVGGACCSCSTTQHPMLCSSVCLACWSCLVLGTHYLFFSLSSCCLVYSNQQDPNLRSTLMNLMSLIFWYNWWALWTSDSGWIGTFQYRAFKRHFAFRSVQSKQVHLHCTTDLIKHGCKACHAVEMCFLDSVFQYLLCLLSLYFVKNIIALFIFEWCTASDPLYIV